MIDYSSEILRKCYENVKTQLEELEAENASLRNDIMVYRILELILAVNIVLLSLRGC